jgi:hypothetical protein
MVHFLHCSVRAALTQCSRALCFGVSAACLTTSLWPGDAHAATTTFTSRTAFESSLPVGFYFNDFSSVPDAIVAPVTSIAGSGGTPTIAYTIAAPDGGVGVFPDSELLGAAKAIGNWVQAQDVVVTFESGNVASAGASFWLSDINGVRFPGLVTVNFSNGSTMEVPSAADGPLGFFGITTTDGPLTSMTIVRNAERFLNFTHFSTAPSAGSAAVPGDYNNSGVVGPEDYTLWSSSFGGPSSALQNKNPAKVGTVVDASDYTFWRDLRPASVAAASSVPEPRTLLGAALSLLAFVGYRRTENQ